ncbi:hypothetical protein FE810_15575 [Thalassotalea litorea]|uniref:Uncharacterized protein n=1 Tax=Thalassotalea litorea TaxID=2020715 RepID=A0A5R9IBW2_9GAMM|nr:hypothetical protein [Thalassotalea litorea]TLU61091.1 hypothetical protein FE810_15575 [Thalassotalea litorea]
MKKSLLLITSAMIAFSVSGASVEDGYEERKTFRELLSCANLSQTLALIKDEKKKLDLNSFKQHPDHRRYLHYLNISNTYEASILSKGYYQPVDISYERGKATGFSKGILEAYKINFSSELFSWLKDKIKQCESKFGSIK